MSSDCEIDQEPQQGHICVSTDPRRVVELGGRPVIISLGELRALLNEQQSLEDQTVWLTTDQAGFPVTTDENEIQNDRDRLLGKPVPHYLHPAISNFILKRQEELISTGQALSSLPHGDTNHAAGGVMGRTRPDARMTDNISPRTTSPDTETWQPDPRPIMTNHPPRITDSNIRISLSEGSLDGLCPKDDSGLGWVQIQRKSLFWEEKIDGFSDISYEGITTLTHPQIG
jgi:hypothetical protein